jgi:hypothetical protein
MPRDWERERPSAQKRLRLSIFEMIGSPVITGRKLQELFSRAWEAALAGQCAEPVRHFSIVRAARRDGTSLSPAHRHELPDAWLRHELLSERWHQETSDRVPRGNRFGRSWRTLAVSHHVFFTFIRGFVDQFFYFFRRISQKRREVAETNSAIRPSAGSPHAGVFNLLANP